LIFDSFLESSVFEKVQLCLSGASKTTHVGSLLAHVALQSHESIRKHPSASPGVSITSGNYLCAMQK
jgi:hypothetical protein